MKKTAFFAAVVIALSVFSSQALAEEVTAPGSKELTLNATKGVSYTLSIPSGTKTVDIASESAQEIGEIGLTSANFTTGSIDVPITSANSFALKNGTVSVAYTLDAADNKYSFDKDDVSGTLTKVNLTVTDPAQATVAGAYSDTLTFTAAANGVA